MVVSPINLHQRLKKDWKTCLMKYCMGMKKLKGAGSHAEIFALNEALLSRSGSNLSDYMIYVIKSNGSTKLRGTPVPRCPHCDYLTQGTNFIPEVLIYGKKRR
ncbi:YwqJ-related putative deaminase [Brevibacillus laterosporus]|uniref:YwqJ-related putative deaminase n=1 Tax=Brevibacillus laterosporus TaxID=1465 RepID=UPI0009DDEECA